MIEVRGPDNIQRFTFGSEGVTLDSSNAFFTTANTLEQALQAYCLKFGSKIKAYDGKLKDIPLNPNEKKYFYYQSNDARLGEALVDIHITKANGEELCYKQDLNVPLEEGDIITLGMPAC